MTDVTEHDSEQEWEGDHAKHTWVDFFVGWNAISVSDLLERSTEARGSEVCGWCGIEIITLSYLWDVDSTLCDEVLDQFFQVWTICWAPKHAMIQ